MPQETNLNVSPYFDDFDPQKNYYKVLFKPGYPVQARELTGLQSILQNQIEQFGNHVFKEGSVVIPGALNYNNRFTGVALQDTFNGADVDLYIDNLLDSVIVGETSGVKARVVFVLKKNQTDNPNTVLYVKYLNTSSSGNEVFLNSENLVAEQNVTPGFSETTSIQPNQAFATTLNSNASVLGSSVLLSEGVYFLRGAFANVYSQTVVLDYNKNTPTYKVGFLVEEEIINSDIDPSLVDNAKGFSNYAAPGADRFKITARLVKLPLDDNTTPNFVELIRIQDGILVRFNPNTDYNLLADELARRTYDESGDYYVKPFKVEVKNSLNDGKGNGGIFKEGQLTYQNETPSDDLGCYRISPGKAYVKGYETELISTTLVDFDKPRTTKTLNDQSIIYSTGATYSLNRVYGSPSLGISTSYTVSLRDSRVGADQYSASGKEIGIARVYDFALESGSYNTAFPNTNNWEISLYDIQTYTEISLNEPITLSTPTFIRGKATGATGFLRYNASNSGIITAYNVSGTFAIGEKFFFDGIENSRVATAITSYGTGDVKSLYGLAGTASTFTADTRQYARENAGSVNITAEFAGISTVTSSDFTFVGVATEGNLVSFSKPGDIVPTFAKIVTVSSRSLTISGITTVSGICDGGLPTTQINPSQFNILKSSFLNSTDNTLYTPLPKDYISSIDLTDSQLITRRQFDVVISSNSLTIPPTELSSNEVFMPFDEERYVLIRDDGSTEPLENDQFAFTTGGKELTINGLTSDGNAKLITTVQKIRIKARTKNKNRVNSVIINKSIYSYSGTNTGVGNTTNNDGLVYGSYPYGTRVQDDQICLNVPEVTKIHAIFESSGIQDPTTPVILLQNISSPTGTTSEIIIGEEIVGRESGNVAICLEKPNSLTVGYVSLNELSFIEGEIIEFKESKITAIISTVSGGSNNITEKYRLNSGQKSTILDYSRIIRNSNALSPTKKIKVYYESAYIPASDTGDITIVDSYNQFDYCDLPTVDNNKISDIIDARPRVDTFDPETASYSPFEFFGRSFDQEQNSSLDILASDEAIVCNYSFYLGRIDRLYLATESNNYRISDSYERRPIVLLKQGIPSESPQLPDDSSDALEIARITLPPYLCDLREASINLIEHKRYRMMDIARLETRIKNLEFYTTLSLLENNAKNLQIKDANGLERFKSGIFVDNFSTTAFQRKVTVPKNSIDVLNGELRPSPFTTELDLLIGSRSFVGIGTIINPNADIKYVTDLIANNVKRSGITPSSTGKGVITLDYQEVLEFSQPLATRIENVTPYLVTSYIGIVDLNPTSDVWVDQTRVESLTVEGITGKTYEVELDLVEAEVINDPQGGWAPIAWNAWENNWTGSTTDTAVNGWITTITNTQTGTATRTGTTTRTLNPINQVSLGDRVVGIDINPFMRSRNIEFVAKKLKPFTQVYAFFDGQDMSEYVVPKLMEVEMLEGTFAVGETVLGLSGQATEFKVRLAVANHRYGPLDAPTDVFTKNPYNQLEDLPGSYTTNSTILNIDTISLADFCSWDFYGQIYPGMIVVGQSSKARARVTTSRLVTDNSGVVIGSFFIPNPRVPTNPRFSTGIKTLKITSNSTNNPIPNELLSQAESNFYAEGLITQNRDVILALRDTEIQNANVTATRAIQQVNRTVIDRTPPPPPPPWSPPPWNWGGDPLAQSFYIGDDADSTGRYVTSIDLFFQSKDEILPVVLELRSMVQGTPTTEIYPFSTVVVNPDEINLSDDASVPTRITFPAPVYLEGNKQHAVIIISDSTKYSVWVSRIGEVDITTASGPESAQVFVTTQTFLGSLFKSQNSTTWTASQYEDLKFNLYTARFVEDGFFTMFSPDLTENNKQIATLVRDSVQTNSRRIRVGLGTTVTDNGLEIGNLITQDGSNASGTYVGAGGSIAPGTLQIINAGIGYTPSSGSQTYNDVSLTSVTGLGRNATANITIQNGVAIAATVSIGGTGYVVGDVLTASSIGISSLGRNLRLSVVGIAGTNEFVLDNVQGEFAVGIGNSLYYSSNTGAGVTSINGGGVFVTSTPIVESDGLHIRVNHRNHGMHSRTNTVVLSKIASDIEPARLALEYTSNSIDDITLTPGFSTSFTTFENVGVGTTNVGYILIDNEILSYSGVSGDTLTGVSRGVDSTLAVTHSVSSPVYKYELSGVSLRRINKSHSLQDATVDDPIGLDYYTIRIDTSSNGVNRTSSASFPSLYLNSTKSTGGSLIKATQNIPFEIARPVIQTLVHPQTNLAADMRTISGTSISGTEISFEDQGFEAISLDSNNYFSSPRMIASKVNETEKLGSIPGNKSMELIINLSTTDNRLTPSIDLDRIGMIFASNRVNSVIDDYAADVRVSTLRDDPSAFTYATRPIQLEIPATSIRILVSAYINPYADLRAFYAIMNNVDDEPIYYPFPGYANRLESGQVINSANNDGTSDVFVPKNNTLGFESNEITFKDYEFSVDNLESFRYFSIKVIGTSTNQAYPPRLRDFRVISLA